MSEQHTLRPYQEEAIKQIREHFANGTRKVMLHLATGGGKTTVFSHVLKSLALRGNKGAIVVRGRKLVDQAHKRLLRESVPHGVVMANHWAINRLAPISVCSIDTCISRSLIPTGKLLVIDEAHLFVSEACVKFCNDWLAQNPDGFILSVTATPYVTVSLRHLADVIVKTVSMQDLIDQGFLVPPVYLAPTTIDVSDVKVSRMTQDYVTADLESILNHNDIVGDLVESWRKHAENRSTLVFGVSIAHSKHIAQMYCDAGIPFVHCDADSTDQEREDAIRKLESGEIKGISNVGIFCTGVDIPSLGCVQFARPTKSYNLYAQMAGRGTRPFRGKNNFILLDNAGNVLRHGFLTNEPEANLDGRKPSNSASILIKTCKKCFAIYEQFATSCPQCGHVNENVATGERMANHVDGDLVKLEEMPIEARAFMRHKELKKIKKDKGLKRGWLYYRMAAEFGEEIAAKYVPKRELPDWLKR